MKRSDVKKASALLGALEAFDEIRKHVRKGEGLYVAAINGETSLWGEITIEDTTDALGVVDMLEHRVRERLAKLGVKP
jgi:hypothetical protein